MLTTPGAWHGVYAMWEEGHSSFMCDRLGTARLGVDGTSNGRRASPRHSLLGRMSNTILAAGETSQQTMLAGMERGLLVDTTLGNRSNAYGDPTRFKVVESYLVERGKIAAPPQSFVLTGKPLDVLPQISQIADDGVPATGMCGLPESGVVPYGDSQPSIRVDGGLQIAGPLDIDHAPGTAGRMRMRRDKSPHPRLARAHTQSVRYHPMYEAR